VPSLDVRASHAVHGRRCQVDHSLSLSLSLLPRSIDQRTPKQLDQWQRKSLMDDGSDKFAGRELVQVNPMDQVGLFCRAVDPLCCSCCCCSYCCDILSPESFPFFLWSTPPSALIFASLSPRSVFTGRPETRTSRAA